jgi:hypothetical protein
MIRYSAAVMFCSVSLHSGASTPRIALSPTPFM